MNNYSYQVSNNAEDIHPNFNFNHIETNPQYDISEEIMPLVQKLVVLCEQHGFFIKILNRATIIRNSLINDLCFDFIAAHEATENQINLSYHNFGLAFGIGIYESSALGHLKYIDHDVLYSKVGKLGETLGLNWASNHQSLKQLRYFEFRPLWAKNMQDREMMNELYRRKKANMSLIADLEKN